MIKKFSFVEIVEDIKDLLGYYVRETQKNCCQYA